MEGGGWRFWSPNLVPDHEEQAQMNWELERGYLKRGPNGRDVKGRKCIDEKYEIEVEDK